MQSTTQGRGPKNRNEAAMMPIAKMAEETSGLHDLKALASSTKQRRSQRLSSQMEAQESLLQAAASLEAVALPDPSKEQPVTLAAVVLNDEPVVATAAAAVELSAAELSISDTPKSSSKFVIMGVVGVAAAAMAFYMSQGSKTESDSVAALAVVAQAPADELLPEEAVQPEVKALVDDEPKIEVAEVAVEAIAPAEAVVVAPTKSEEKKAKIKTAKATAKATTKPKRAKAASASVAKAKAKAEPKKAKKGAKAPTVGGGASLDDVLSSVTGGIDKPIVAEKKDNKPSKKSLNRGDVARAMKGISSSAKGCYSTEEYTGTVIVKYSVSGDGSITKIKAMGAHASSKTGKCVMKAVKKAKFPAFDGSIQSFSFPFLLSP